LASAEMPLNALNMPHFYPPFRTPATHYTMPKKRNINTLPISAPFSLLTIVKDKSWLRKVLRMQSFYKLALFRQTEGKLLWRKKEKK
jgi:hypothetical protein